MLQTNHQKIINKFFNQVRKWKSNRDFITGAAIPRRYRASGLFASRALKLGLADSISMMRGTTRIRKWCLQSSGLSGALEEAFCPRPAPPEPARLPRTHRRLIQDENAMRSRHIKRGETDSKRFFSEGNRIKLEKGPGRIAEVREWQASYSLQSVPLRWFLTRANNIIMYFSTSRISFISFTPSSSSMLELTGIHSSGIRSRTINSIESWNEGCSLSGVSASGEAQDSWSLRLVLEEEQGNNVSSGSLEVMDADDLQVIYRAPGTSISPSKKTKQEETPYGKRLQLASKFSGNLRGTEPSIQEACESSLVYVRNLPSAISTLDYNAKSLKALEGSSKMRISKEIRKLRDAMRLLRLKISRRLRMRSKHLRYIMGEGKCTSRRGEEAAVGTYVEAGKHIYSQVRNEASWGTSDQFRSQRTCLRRIGTLKQHTKKKEPYRRTGMAMPRVVKAGRLAG
nr:hypothetical protein Iba_chr08bCG7960 [Ipomoea batatas]